MADVNGKSDNEVESALAKAAGRVLENLAELEPQLVEAAIFDRNREPVVVTADSPDWASEGAGLLESLEAASGDEDLDSAHIASAQGEVFVVSESGLTLVAVTGRFVLASLTAYDMRMSLRDLARAAGGAAGEASSEAENSGSDNA